MDANKNDRKQKYARAKHLLSTGYFTCLTELIEAVGIMNLVDDMPLSHKALKRRLENLEYLSMGDLKRIGELLVVDPVKLSELGFKEMNQPRKKRK